MRRLTKLLAALCTIVLFLAPLSAAAAPFDTPRTGKKQAKREKKEKIKLSPAEKDVLAQFEEALAQCVIKKTVDTERLCAGKYPDKKKKNPPKPALQGKGDDKKDRVKLSAEARDCVKYFENAAALVCVDRLSRRAPERVYNYWLIRNDRVIEKISGEQKKSAQYSD